MDSIDLLNKQMKESTNFLVHKSVEHHHPIPIGRARVGREILCFSTSC